MLAQKVGFITLLTEEQKFIANETLTTTNAFFYSKYLVWQYITLALMPPIRWLGHFLQK